MENRGPGRGVGCPRTSGQGSKDRAKWNWTREGVHRVRSSQEVKLREVEECALMSQAAKANPILRAGVQLRGEETGWQADRVS